MPISQSLKGGTSVDCGDLLAQKKRWIMVAVQASKPVKGGQTQITKAQMTGYDSGLFSKGLDYYLINNTPVGPICGVIDITDIATYDSGNSWYVLNGDYTITACQILNIAVGITLRINAGQTLTNNGTINNASYLRNFGTFNNNGTFNNTLNIFNANTINNNGTFNNNTTGNIFNNFGTINNTSIINNTGITYNDGGTTINNSGVIYISGGGETYNDSTINNTGTISTSNGGPCGAGTLTNNGTINNTGSGTQNTNCPP